MLTSIQILKKLEMRIIGPEMYITMTPFTYSNSFILRPDPGLLALIFEQGYSDIGYPSALSRNTRVFIASETAKVFLNLPTNLPNISVSDSHPLESTYGGGLIFNVDGIGGLVGYNILNDIDYNDAYDPDNTIYNNWAGQLYWTKAFKFKNSLKVKTLKIIKKQSRCCLMVFKE